MEGDIMTTTIRYEHNGPMSLAHLLSDDGGHCYVWSTIPGRPYFQFRLDSSDAVPVDGAPMIETHKAFKAFVTERFT
jgi:hypothetical protein